MDLLAGEWSIARLPAAEPVADWLWPERFSSGDPYNSFVVIEGDRVCPGKQPSRLFAWVSGVPEYSWERFWERAGGGATNRLRRCCFSSE